jgi:hypothetical protein
MVHEKFILVYGCGETGVEGFEKCGVGFGGLGKGDKREG